MDIEERVPKSHVLALPAPFQGHINPMLQLCKNLSSRGTKITFVVASPNISVQIESNLIMIESIPAGSDEGLDKTSESYIENLKASILKHLPLVLESKASSGEPVKVLVCDSIFPWAIDVAHRLGIRAAALFTQSGAVSTIYYHLFHGTFKIPVEGPEIELPSLPPLEPNDLPSLMYDAGAYPFVLRIILDGTLNFGKADWLLFNTHDTLENEANGIVVYVSFGTLASLGNEEMAEIARGLANINCNFLSVVQTSDQNKLRRNFVSNLKESLVVNWCPQLEVLAHPAVGCFVTQCGWNSTLEALSLGVPMVVIPQWTDQPTSAKFIVDVWQVGVRAKTNEKGIVTKEEIEICIQQVLWGGNAEKFKKNAATLKELAKEAMSEGGSSDKNIGELVLSFSRA